MIQELVYTSAARGLKAGSRGFCTVLSTQGMPAPLAVLLEGLSAYRHVFPPDHPQVDLNPVTWAHSLLTVGGKRYSVLSRVADHGLDYSERTNKLAHHLVLESSDRPRGGPAWLLAQPGVMRSDWDGEPRVIPPGRGLPVGDVLPSVCQAWQDMTGDAGWAGVLAESFLKDPDRPVYLLFRPGMDVLPLIREAISLLPVERRWDVTFSTYATNVAKGVTCQWRCLLADAPEAHQSRRFVRALRLNLCEALGRAEGGALVDLARTGRSAAPVETASLPVARKLPETDERDDAPYQLQRQKAAPPPTRLPTRPQPPARPAATGGGRRRFLTVAFVAVVLLITVGLTIAHFVRQPSHDNEPVVVAAASDAANDVSNAPPQNNDPRNALQGPEGSRGSAPDVTASPGSPPATQTPAAPDESEQGDDASSEGSSEEPDTPDGAPSEVPSVLAARNGQDAVEPAETPAEPPDGIWGLQLEGDAPMQFETLDLDGIRLASDAVLAFFAPAEVPEPVEPLFSIDTPRNGSKLSILFNSGPHHIADISLDSESPDSLQVEWDNAGRANLNSIRWCALQVRSPGESPLSFVFHNRAIEPTSKNFEDGVLEWELPVSTVRSQLSVRGPHFQVEQLVLQVGDQELAFQCSHTEGDQRDLNDWKNGKLELDVSDNNPSQSLLTGMQLVTILDNAKFPRLIATVVDETNQDPARFILQWSGCEDFIDACTSILVNHWSLHIQQQLTRDFGESPQIAKESEVNQIRPRRPETILQQRSLLEDFSGRIDRRMRELTDSDDEDEQAAHREYTRIDPELDKLVNDAKRLAELQEAFASLTVVAAHIFYEVSEVGSHDEAEPLEVDVIRFDHRSDSSAPD